jgi:hypothetical protein
MSTLKVSPGYTCINEEFEASLRRAFVDSKCDFIILDDRHQRFLIESVNFGVEQGWLKGSWAGADEQDEHMRFRLTKKGQEHFGLDS